jgi:diguanylate cyclase (GGDEF)-like protein
VLLVDLDRFKEVNDTLGHDCGDEILRQVASRILLEVRSQDTLARLGGDEFALALPEIGSPEAAREAAGRICAALERPFSIRGFSVQLEASVGVALAPKHGDDVKHLLQRADVARPPADGGRNDGIKVDEPYPVVSGPDEPRGGSVATLHLVRNDGMEVGRFVKAVNQDRRHLLGKSRQPHTPMPACCVDQTFDTVLKHRFDCLPVGVTAAIGAGDQKCFALPRGLFLGASHDVGSIRRGHDFRNKPVELGLLGC